MTITKTTKGNKVRTLCTGEVFEIVGPSWSGFSMIVKGEDGRQGVVPGHTQVEIIG